MRRQVAVVDLGFGDAGKGTVVDWLAATRPVHTVVRFNGGAQAGHNVVTDDGRWHTFSQFGAGTFRGARTFLSRFAVFDPLSLTFEAEHLASLGVGDPYAGLSVDRAALVSTPYHRAANQAREIARGAARHGSCGMGVGETVAYALDRPDAALRAGDLRAPATLRATLTGLRDWAASVLDAVGVAAGALRPGLFPPVEDCAEVFAMVADRVAVVGGDALGALLRAETCVFEGAQGVLLDEWRGFHPYTTWSTTTFDNAAALAAEAGVDDVLRLGVVRTTTTRHGAGPLPTESPALTATLADPRNPTNSWQGAFRVGHFDAVLHRYAVEVAGGVDALAVTHLDAPARRPHLRVGRAYELGGRTVTHLAPGPFGDLEHQAALTAQLEAAVPRLDTRAPGDWASTVGETLDAPVALGSFGPAVADKRLLAATAI